MLLSVLVTDFSEAWQCGQLLDAGTLAEQLAAQEVLWNGACEPMRAAVKEHNDIPP